jgi:hypothetical protein
MKDQSAASALETKEAFEAYAESHGVDIQHYHVNNGIFAAHLWKDSCRISHQGLTFAGVNAHHQNGRAKRKIRSLQDQARSQLIHSHHRWPSEISANMWPYTILSACDSLNATPTAMNCHKASPLQVFSQSEVVEVHHKH